MKNRPNYYRVLQVQPDALPEIINASYRTMMRELKKHPDLGGSTAEAALLNEAYEILGDPSRRAAYDEELFFHSIQTPDSRDKKPSALACCPVCNRPLSQKPAPGEICQTCRTPLPSDRQQESIKTRGRSLDRIKNSDPIYYYSEWPGKAKQGRMIDFSPKGMRFISSEKLMLESVLKISCKLFEASGTITNVNEEKSDGQECYSVGVRFIAVRFEESRGTFLCTSA
jgi:curved DNA-binding protein CbpA